jgi:hypothetical protein
MQRATLELTESTNEFGAGEPLGVFFAPNFPLDKSHFLVYILSP